MATLASSAADIVELMTEFRDFLEANDWTINEFTAGASNDDTTTLHASSPFTSFASNPVFVNMRSVFNTGLGQYGIEMSVSKAYNSLASWGGQVGESPSVFLNLWSGTIGYWFYVSSRRAVMVTNCSTIYGTAYAGMFLPFAKPSEYNYPFYVGSAASILEGRIPSTAYSQRFIADPSPNTAFYFSNTSASWKEVSNKSATGIRDDGISAGIWPHFELANPAATTHPDFANFFEKIRPNANGETFVYPCHIIDVPSQEIIGVLEGVYGVPGFGLGSENVISTDDGSFRVFQDHNKISNSSFLAVAEI